MPFRETYEIASQEEGKAAQRDQSYRSCVIALLIFFFLCLILIVSCIPWKIRNLADNADDTKQHVTHDSQYGDDGPQTQQTTKQIFVSTTTATRRKTTKAHTSTITSTEEHVSPETLSHVEPSSQTAKDEASPTSPTSKTSPTSPTILQEKTTHHITTTKRIPDYTENKEKDLTTLYVITDNTIDNDATSTSPRTGVLHTTTMKDVAANEPHATTKSVEERVTDEHSPNTIYSTMKSEFVTEKSTDFDTLATTKGDTAIETGMSSTTANALTETEESTDTKYTSHDHHHETSQFNTSSTHVLVSTSPITIISEENKTSEEFTTKYSDDKDFMTSSESSRTSINENLSTESFTTTEKYSDEKVSPITEVKSETEASITIIYETTEKSDATSATFEKYTTPSGDDHTPTTIPASSVLYDTTISSETQTEMQVSTTEEIKIPEKEPPICETGRCKQIASKMFSYMNHSADPCEDFYEYACGGFEANPQVVDGETVLKSRNYQQIAREMSKRKNSIFTTYYDSCVQYEKTTNFIDRAKMASDSLSEIGQFYISNTWSNSYMDFTNLFTQLLLHNSALLFDIVPELDEEIPNSFTLRIGPVIYDNSLIGDDAEDLCSEDLETTERYVNLEVMYDNYKRCKNDTTELMTSIKEALTILNVFKGVNDSYLEMQAQFGHIEKTVDTINSIILQGYFSQFPSNEIRKKYLTNNYKKISLQELGNSCEFINWMQVINSLGINEIYESTEVYVYDTLIQNLQKLQKFGMKHPMNLNNAIMGLYAHKLYRELVIPRRNNVKDYCLQVAIRFLRLEASNLYISSFADDEMAQINKLMEDTFNELKETLKLEMEKAQWVKQQGRERLLEKIDSLKLSLPAISYFKERNSLYNKYNIPQISLLDNYFNNTMMLSKWYRTLMYAEVKGEVDDPQQIWTYYATPFQSQARVIYNLNLNVIPYGIIDWSLLNNEFSFKYFALATLGNLIAHQIAHHFDANGIYYWNHIRNHKDTLMYEDDFAEMNFGDYVDCQNNSVYQGSINMTLPFTNQIVSFTIPQFTLNERMSDIMGLRLAYDTLVRTMSDAEKGLPWIKFRTEQLFYLAYAQMHCTKKPLTSSYVSLYEDESLPSRIRVLVSASNDKRIAQLWKCPTGSQIAPSDVCSVFPDLDFKANNLIISL